MVISATKTVIRLPKMVIPVQETVIRLPQTVIPAAGTVIRLPEMVIRLDLGAEGAETLRTRADRPQPC